MEMYFGCLKVDVQTFEYNYLKNGLLNGLLCKNKYALEIKICD